MGRDNGEKDEMTPDNGAETTPATIDEASAAGASSAEAPAALTPEPAAEAQARLEALEQEKLELRDRMLRLAADFDNFKKRSRKEMTESETRGREALLKELLGVIDNLERAVAHASAADNGSTSGGLLEGVNMVLRQFLATLEKFDVKPFSALGEAFDPQFHAAVQQVPTADKPAGMVVEEFQRGFKVGARLLRPAMVAVATPPRASEGQGGDGAGEGAPANKDDEAAE